MPKTVMIAANDPNILYLLQRYAEESGFCTIKTGRGKEVAELARQHQPSLIILELDPSGLIGRNVLRQLRAAPATRTIPVVAYSHSREEVGEVQGYAADRFAALLCESLMYDDFLEALQQAGVEGGQENRERD